MYTILALSHLPQLSGNNYYIYHMTKYIAKFFVTGLLLLCSFFVNAQDDTSKKKYRIHTVEEEQTLYSISKLYDVTVDEILNLNPDVKVDELKNGTVLILPNKPKPTIDNTLPDSVLYVLHTVEPQQTFYRLKVMYDVTQEELIELNPELEDGLKVGQVIKIRKKKLTVKTITPEVEEKATEVEEDEPSLLDFLFKSKKDTLKAAHLPDTVKEIREYNVAVMLPLYLNQNDTIEFNTEFGEDEQIYNRSKVALEFYAGLQIAVDSLVKQGLTVNLHVYDTDNNKKTINEIISKPEFETMDLVIGPLFASSVEMVAEALQKDNIPVVSPFANNDFTEKRTNLIQVLPSKDAELLAIANHINANYAKDNIILLCQNIEEEKNSLESLKSNLLTQSDSVISIQEYIVKTERIDKAKVLQMMEKDRKNIFVIPSKDQVFMSDLFTKMNDYADSSNVFLYGLSKLRNVETIENRYFVNLNLHTPSNTNTNYTDTATICFINKYRQLNLTEPSVFALQGFDVSYYFLNLLKVYGNVIPSLDYIKAEEINTGFDFQKVEDGGYRNTYNCMLRYHKFKLIKL